MAVFQISPSWHNSYTGRLAKTEVPSPFQDPSRPALYSHTVIFPFTSLLKCWMLAHLQRTSLRNHCGLSSPRALSDESSSTFSLSIHQLVSTCFAASSATSGRPQCALMLLMCAPCFRDCPGHLNLFQVSFLNFPFKHSCSHSDVFCATLSRFLGSLSPILGHS